VLHHISKREKIIVLIAVLSGLFLAALDQTIVGTALPKILTEFNALEKLSWVVTAYLLASTVSVPIAGKLSDIYGRRKLLMSGITIFVIGSMLSGVSQDIDQLIAFRAIQGIGGGILFANAFSIIGDLFVPAERGKWMGVFGAVFGLSSVVGPLLGGWLTDGHSLLGATTDWRWTFYINVPIGIISFGMIARYLPTIVAKVKHSIDYLGAVLLTGGLGSLILATSLGGTKDWAWDSARIIGLFVAAVVLILSFLFVETKAKDPILPLRFFKNPIFAVASILIFIFGIGMFGAIIYIPLFAQDVLNFSATNAGIILLPMILGLTVASAIAGRVVSSIGRYKTILVAGMGVAVVGIFTLTGLTPQSGYWDLAWRMVVTGLGLGVGMPLINLAVQNSFHQKDIGTATASTQLFRSIGSTVGIAVMGGLLNNILTQKLSGIQDDPFVKMAAKNGTGDQFAHIDVNSVQGILSQQGQESIHHNISQMPTQVQHTVLDAFGHFVGTVQSALSHSITQIFLISAALMSVAFVVSFFIKEIPMKHHVNDDEATPSPSA
jgi:EmrB/QacA subfamily drug resistance transporter